MSAAVERPPLLASPVAVMGPTPLGLQPFDHQVAGQSLILRYNDTTLCKCLIPREHAFYQRMPESLQPFVPQYRGVNQLILPDPDTFKDTEKENLSHSPHHERPSPYKTTPSQAPPSSQRVPPSFSPAQLRGMRGLRKSSRTGLGDGGSLYYFLLLEDLISGYDRPCILDLKAGTRQHGDDAPPEKIAYQVNKCTQTTSATLGLRLCGMKRYVETSNNYDNKDKVFGRNLSDEEMKLEIIQFLFNGKEFRHDVVKPLLDLLERLRNVVRNLEGYRFYSCSLLIVYEGNCDKSSGSLCQSHLMSGQNGRWSGQNGRHEDYSLNQIHSSTNTRLHPSEEVPVSIIPEGKLVENISCDGFDSGSLTTSSQTSVNGQNNSQGKYEKDSNDDTIDSGSVPSPGISQTSPESCLQTYSCLTPDNHVSASSDSIADQKPHSPHCLEGYGDSSSQVSRLVDVRIVDFAHATFPGFCGDTVTHEGPDHGFLRGIDTLLEVLTNLLEAKS
ncbi:inositol hexakisphosphate kinase 3 [Aplysia californica]|uniref:Kinase n=1 Tax=Aplysia californica TaxID=6500 RepID=A0ABM0JJF5_APLCA|nr:inositol hexakisphosphate kinase 3 [Aplysia californica]